MNENCSVFTNIRILENPNETKDSKVKGIFRKVTTLPLFLEQP